MKFNDFLNRFIFIASVLYCIYCIRSIGMHASSISIELIPKRLVTYKVFKCTNALNKYVKHITQLNAAYYVTVSRSRTY